jgi:hypothetical protein
VVAEILAHQASFLAAAEEASGDWAAGNGERRVSSSSPEFCRTSWPLRRLLAADYLPAV